MKILMVNEGSHLSTGYGTYGKELLNRLFKTGKYELAEFACSTSINDIFKFPRPWKVYPNSPNSSADPQWDNYTEGNNGKNGYGAWRFDRVLLDFQPDIVFDIRDYWMLSYQNASPLRPYFHWAIMPTVDSAPQHESWIETFIEADGVLTYSEWGRDILQQQGGGLIKLSGVASPGVDLEIFRPRKDKAAVRDKLGLISEMNIIGTVMRNQKRKLYPELFEAFSKFIHMCIDRGRADLAKNTYIYAHTAYPDLGWNIPHLINEHGLSHKVLTTYLCHNCGHYFTSFFQDAKTICKECNSLSATTPSTRRGLTREQLAEIYTTFDCYIQYANCEGFGMPQVEAISSGLPLMAIDYSAMSEVVRRSEGYPLEIKNMFFEPDVGAYRACPDTDDTARKIFKFFSQPAPVRAKKGFIARQAAERFYNWDITAKIWENYFDGVKLRGLQGKWDAPANIHIPPSAPPKGFENWNNETFVEWLMSEVLHEPEKNNSYRALKILQMLNHGSIMEGKLTRPVSKADVFEGIKAEANHNTYLERCRTQLDQLETPDFIRIANGEF